MEDLKNIIESLLFVSDEPLSVGNIKNVLAVDDPRDIRSALNELADDYRTRQGAFLLHEVAGGFQIRTRPEYNQWIKRLIHPKSSRLSKAALETLAIIAYKQPTIRSDIEHIRGVDCGGVIRILLEKKLVRVLGRKEIPGRPLIYGTTKQFLEVFDLKNLRDLPTPKEIEELRAATGDDADPEVAEQTISNGEDRQNPLEEEEDGSIQKDSEESESYAPEEEPASLLDPVNQLEEGNKDNSSREDVDGTDDKNS